MVYDETGRELFRGDTRSLLSYIRSEEINLVTQHIIDADMGSSLWDFVYDEKIKVIADRQGKPSLIRISAGRSTRWIVQAKGWGLDEPVPEDLRGLREFYEYYGVGYKPTTGSLGNALMLETWKKYGLSKHTAPSRACEEYIRRNAVGGIVQTPGKGKHYPEAMMLDMSSAWISQYVLHPTGTAVFFRGEPEQGQYFTYFAECDVLIDEELALGPFPYRTGRSDGKRVVYPTIPGLYKGAFLWREQIDDCRKAGCSVRIIEGYGWRNYTTDNFRWSDESYRLRTSASSGLDIKRCKSCNVSAVGRHFQPREHYCIVGEGYNEDTDTPLVIGRDAVNLYLHKEVDDKTAYMVHWYAYTVAMCNSIVYNFALPFAKEGRLISIDYDSILIIEKDERHHYVKRQSIEALNLPPGTWLWMLLHNVRGVKDRTFIADELSKTPGVSR